MSRKTLYAGAELTRELLPALRMMVRFPTRSEKVVSFNTGLDLDKLEAWTHAHGRPTAATLGAVMKAQGGFEREPEVRSKGAPIGPRMTLEQASTPSNIPPLPSRPLGGLASPAPVREIRAIAPPASAPFRVQREFDPPAVKPAAPAPAVIARKAAAAEVVAAPDGGHRRAWLEVRAMNATLKTYLPVVELWIANPAMMQSDLCARCEVKRGAFSQYKQAHFGTFRGRPPTELLQEWATWARDRLGLDSAPNKLNTVRPPTSTGAVNSVLVKPPASMAELTGKERRHLVASVVCGMLASGHYLAIVDAKLVKGAAEICEEIVRQDAHLEAKGGAS